MPERGVGPLLRTDTVAYELTRVGEALTVGIPYTYENRTGGRVYLANCNGSFSRHLERLESGKWVPVWIPAIPLCLSQPIIIEVGETFASTFHVLAHPPGSNVHPQFDRTDPSGTYRIVWTAAYGSYEDHPPREGQLALEDRVSNGFELTLPR